MNGRKLFDKYRRLIRLLQAIINWIPKSILVLVFNLFDNSESKLAVLYRYLYLSRFSKKSGSNIFIGKRVLIKNIEYLTIGSNVSIHANNYIDAVGGIIIGDNVSIAHNSSLISFEHCWEKQDVPIKYNPIIKKEIILSDDIWIGCGVRILGGSRINKRSIVAAGAVVTGEVYSNTIVGGVPAKIIKEI